MPRLKTRKSSSKTSKARTERCLGDWTIRDGLVNNSKLYLALVRRVGALVEPHAIVSHIAFGQAWPWPQLRAAIAAEQSATNSVFG